MSHPQVAPRSSQCAKPSYAPRYAARPALDCRCSQKQLAPTACSFNGSLFTLERISQGAHPIAAGLLINAYFCSPLFRPKCGRISSFVYHVGIRFHSPHKDITISTESNHVRITLLLRKADADKLDQAVAQTGSSRNAVLAAMVGMTAPVAMGALYDAAVKAEVISPRNRTSKEHKDLVGQLSKLSADELRALMAKKAE